MALFSYVLQATLRGCRRGGPVAGAAVLLPALAVLVAGGVLAGDRALAAAEARWREALRVVVVLRAADPQPEGPDGLVAGVRALDGVAAVRYVTPDAALADLKELLGPRGDGLERLPSNPLPARLEVTPAETLDHAGLARLVAALERLPDASEVQAAHGWVEPVERVRRGLRVGGLGFAAGLALAAVAAAAGTTAVARRGAADELSVLRLAGVPALRLAAPLVLPALGLATLGSLLGLALLLLASEPGALWTAGWLRAALGLEPLPLLPAGWLAALASGGAMLGLTGALAAGRG